MSAPVQGGSVRFAAGRGVARSVAAGLAMVVAVGGLVLAGIGNGYPVTRPRLSSGAAWLVSGRVGQLTLLDGSSVEVAGQVQVAEPGAGLDVVQQGSSAYVVDRSRGAVRRVDGATFEAGTPASPLPGARAGLRVFAGPDGVYTLDAEHGVLAETDPRTLARRGQLVPLSARVDPQGSVLDDAGRLWVLDGETGDLVWLDHGQRHVRPAAATAGAGMLTLAGGTPVLVDTARRTATLIDPATGTAGRSVALDLRPGERVEVSGAAQAPRLYLVTARGVLEVCDLDGGGCATAVPLDTDSGTLGAALETGGRVFVPDYTTGQVWVVDVHGWRVVARPEVLSRDTRFQLLMRDGVVFFNDPDGTRAGVIRLDGGVRAVDKYHPAGDRGRTAAPTPGRPTPSPHTPSPHTSRPSTGGHPPAPPGPTAHPQPSGSPSAPGTQPPPPPPDAPPVQINVSTNPALVDQPVTLQVVDKPPAGQPTPNAARWDFGDGQSGTGVTVTHSWHTSGVFTVAVTATFPGGTHSFVSVSLTVDAPPPPSPSPSPSPPPPPPPGTLTVDVSGPGSVHLTGGGKVSDCVSGGCVDSYSAGTVVTLTANPDAHAALQGWSGSCGGAGSTCTVTVPGGGNVSVGAVFIPVAVLTLTVTTNPLTAGSSVDGCTATCRWTYRLGDTATLTADVVNNDETGIAKVAWGGACTGFGTNPTCTVTMSGDRSASADFVWNCRKPPQCVGSGVSGAALRSADPVPPHRIPLPPSVPASEPRLVRLTRPGTPTRARRGGRRSGH
jgi:PKD domain-containing protein/List-Bact-rpt repeat protein